MEHTEVTALEEVLESFLNSAAGRRKTVSVDFEPSSGRRGTMYVNDELGVEDELQILQQNGFTVYTVKGVNTAKFEDTKVAVDMKVPDPIPSSL